jgi:DNA-binding Lrp family transcriptional regulator
MRRRSVSGNLAKDYLVHLLMLAATFLLRLLCFFVAKSRFRNSRMDPLLKLLHDNAALKPAQLASMLNQSEAEVAAKIKSYEADHSILGYRTILNEEKLGIEIVRAVIEVKITPERGGGFDRLAERIAKYSEVRSCYLMSGGYDLLVIVEGKNLREVATFVSEKLATIQGVISTATHFMLKPYKEQGVMMSYEKNEERLAISP